MPEQLPVESVDRLAASLTPVVASCVAGGKFAVRRLLPGEQWSPPAGPAALLSFSLAKGASGPVSLLLAGAAGLDLARALLGEPATGKADQASAEETDALQELANQAAGALATALGSLLGKPVGFEGPAARFGGAAELLPHATGATAVLLDLAGPLQGEAVLLLPAALLRPASPPGPLLPPLGEPAHRREGNGIEFLLDVTLPITVELGRTRMAIRDVLHLAPGSILELDKLAGEPVDIRVNDRSIARGEVVVIDENFGVRLTSIVTPTERVDSFR